MNLPRDSITPQESVLPEPRGRPVVSATRARQGVTGHNVRYVLGFGLAGVVVAFVVVYIVYFA
jgi:hypothetical protein